MSRWHEVPVTELSVLPRAPGLYCVYLDGALVYVGKSHSLRTRVKQHGLRLAIADGEWKGIAFKSMRLKVRTVASAESLVANERRLIEALQPPLNVTHGPGKRRLVRKPLHAPCAGAPNDAPGDVVRQVDGQGMAIVVSLAAAELTSTEVAPQMGITESYISRLRKGSRPVPEWFVEPSCRISGSNLLRQVRAIEQALSSDSKAKVQRLAAALRSAA